MTSNRRTKDVDIFLPSEGIDNFTREIRSICYYQPKVTQLGFRAGLKKGNSMRNYFGHILAAILLVFYTGTWGWMILFSFESDIPLPGNLELFFHTASIVGGIASALAVAVLGATKPNETPDISKLLSAGEERSLSSANPSRLTAAYLIFWIAIGVLALIASLTIAAPTDEDALSVWRTLKDFSQVWLGMAVSSVMVYFGIDPEKTLRRKNKFAPGTAIHSSSLVSTAESEFVQIPDQIGGVSIEFADDVDRNVTPEMLQAMEHVIKSDIHATHVLSKIWISSAKDKHVCPSRHVTGNAIDLSRVNDKKMSVSYPSDSEVKGIVDSLQNGFETAPRRRENFGPLFKKKEGVPHQVSGHKDHIHWSVNGDHSACHAKVSVPGVPNLEQDECCRIMD